MRIYSKLYRGKNKLKFCTNLFKALIMLDLKIAQNKVVMNYV